jgi:hypothetical protein
MTQEVKPIPRAAQELRKKLQEVGSIGKQETREWLAELDPELDAGGINLDCRHKRTGLSLSL